MRRAGTATTTGRWLRLLLLVGTLLGLSAMHTLGHDAHLAAAGHPADGRPAGHAASADRTSVGHDTPADRPHRTSAALPVLDRGEPTGPVSVLRR
ncbi:hypothetical protein ACWCHM_24975 [Micromonospora sp. SCSIO 07396]